MGEEEYTFYECGTCGEFHRKGFDGDCRDDAERFSLGDIPFTDRIKWLNEEVGA
jgi:hypothetical protein